MIALIACSSDKASKRCKAKDIYTGTLFKKSYELAEKMGAKIYILSAKHHLLDPEQEIDPYNSYLGDFSADDRKLWADEVKRQIKAKHINTDQKVLFFAGEDYIEHLHGIFRNEEQMWKGRIGYILRYLSNKIDENIGPTSGHMKPLSQYIMEVI